MKDSIIKNCRAGFYVENKMAFRKWLKFSISEPKGNSKLLVIMMNPGKSHPMELHKELKKVKKEEFNAELARGLISLDRIKKGNIQNIDCYRDNTQIKVANWMKDHDYEEALVVNLSNYCAHDSEEFYLKLNNNGGIFHSVFACKDIDDILSQQGSGINDVLLAWGVNDVLNSSVQTVLTWLESNKFGFENVYGHQKPGYSSKFYHPMKRKTASSATIWKPNKL